MSNSTQDTKCQQQENNKASLTRSQNTAAVQVNAVITSLPSSSRNAPILFSRNMCITLPLIKLNACNRHIVDYHTSQFHFTHFFIYFCTSLFAVLCPLPTTQAKSSTYYCNKTLTHSLTAVSRMVYFTCEMEHLSAVFICYDRLWWQLQRLSEIVITSVNDNLVFTVFFCGLQNYGCFGFPKTESEQTLVFQYTPIFKYSRCLAEW